MCFFVSVSMASLRDSMPLGPDLVVSVFLFVTAICIGASVIGPAEDSVNQLGG